MTTGDFIRRCRAAGVQLVADGQQLRVRGAARKQFVAKLRERKAEVLDHLQQIASGAAEPADEPEPLRTDPAELENWTAKPEPPGAAPADPRTRPAPSTQAPLHEWRRYFDQELAILEEDLAAEQREHGHDPERGRALAKVRRLRRTG